MTTHEEAVTAFLEGLDKDAAEGLARLVRDDVVEFTAQIARLVAGSPVGLHPSLYGQQLADAMEAVANYAEAVCVSTLLRVVQGADLAAMTR